MRRLVSFRAVKLSIVREKCTAYQAPIKINKARHVADLARAVVGEDPREHMLAIYLDSRHRVIAVHIVSVGTAENTTLHPREFFLPAVHLSASAVLAVHNHPSGDAEPSAEDRTVTERLRDASELLGIEFLDHVVIGLERFYSFADGSFSRF